MPFIISRVNVSLTDEQEMQLKSGLGKAIECVPGKTEASLMVGFENQFRLFLRGDDREPMAYITVAVAGNPDHLGYGRLSAEISQLYHKVLHVPLDRIYIKYEDIAAWSVAGRIF